MTMITSPSIRRLLLRIPTSSILLLQLAFRTAESLPFVTSSSSSSLTSLEKTNFPLFVWLSSSRGGGDGSGDDRDDPKRQRQPQEQQQEQQLHVEERGKLYGRISDDEFRLTPEQIEAFHRDGCVTVPNVLTQDQVATLEVVFDKFLNRQIAVTDRDFCDMSKPFGVVPEQDWSIVNCMLPTRYYPEWQNNLYERLTKSMAQQLFHNQNLKNNRVITMVKDYDQLLTKLPGKLDAVFAWHQDMAYWPGPAALGNPDMTTATATFSLAVDDSTEETGCLRYVAGSGAAKRLREHRPLCGTRDEGHALTVDVDESTERIRLAPALRGSVTIHDEYVVHGSGGNASPTSKRRTYVLAYRAEEIVEAERRIGFTHSHNDQVNWDTFQDGESHRINQQQQKQGQQQQPQP